jgi:hypothetical protein
MGKKLFALAGGGKICGWALRTAENILRYESAF